MDRLNEILHLVADGGLSPEEAAQRLTTAEADLGFARLDLERERRRGLPEVIYCPGKSAQQIAAIVLKMRDAGQDVFASRASPEQYAVVRDVLPDAVYHPTARTIILHVNPPPEPAGLVTLVCAGTSDLPVAEEAALVAEYMGARVERLWDVGVSGLHRLMRHIDLIRSANAVVVVAGMEGALPSVVAGLIDKPVIAVPTSVGYGTSMHGIAALLAMLNTCVPGVTVVNIDNGFGAGVAAAMINRVAEQARDTP